MQPHSMQDERTRLELEEQLCAQVPPQSPHAPHNDRGPHATASMTSLTVVMPRAALSSAAQVAEAAHAKPECVDLVQLQHPPATASNRKAMVPVRLSPSRDDAVLNSVRVVDFWESPLGPLGEE